MASLRQLGKGEAEVELVEESLDQHIVRLVELWLVKAHRPSEPAEDLLIRQRLADWLSDLLLRSHDR